MGQRERDDEAARAELKHALDALGDGAGAKQWGPGPVIAKLSKRNAMACEAFEMATMVTHDLFCLVKREDAMPAIRRLAPVFLEMLLERQEASFVFDRQLARKRRETTEHLAAQQQELSRESKRLYERYMAQIKAQARNPLSYLGNLAGK